MSEEGKKISFGFSKSIKKPVLKKLEEQETKKVDFIACLDEKSIKVIGGEEKEDEPLVIPMLGSRTWHERILNKVDADIFETKIKNEESEGNEKAIKMSNGQVSSNNIPMDITEIKKESDEEEKPVSLEEQAAQEILKDLGKEVKVEVDNFTVPITDDDNLEGRPEATLEDYEQIPIESFGIAMLRGMGWKPGRGLGKKQQIITPKLPELRPKGMGLGADKAVLKKKHVEPKTKEEEQLKLIVGAFVKINGGKYSDKYGELKGFDDDAGRLIVKLAIGGDTVSFNECLVEPVTKAEYTKNSKVLNVTKYEEYSRKDLLEKKQDVDSNTSESIKRKSDDSSDEDRRSRRQKSSSSSSDERKLKKKHRSRDKNSSKHSKKNKKKEKHRERRSNYSESLDRRKNKKRRRRSRS